MKAPSHQPVSEHVYYCIAVMYLPDRRFDVSACSRLADGCSQELSFLLKHFLLASFGYFNDKLIGIN